MKITGLNLKKKQHVCLNKKNSDLKKETKKKGKQISVNLSLKSRGF